MVCFVSCLVWFTFRRFFFGALSPNTLRGAHTESYPKAAKISGLRTVTHVFHTFSVAKIRIISQTTNTLCSFFLIFFELLPEYRVLQAVSRASFYVFRRPANGSPATITEKGHTGVPAAVGRLPQSPLLLAVVALRARIYK